MRTMCDACNPANYEGGHDLYASYVDGSCATNSNTAVRISSIGTNAGNVGDCEPGNPGPSFWPTWVTWRRAAGVDPTIYVAADQLGSYFNGYKYTNVVNAFNNAGVVQPHYWICYPGLSYIPDGAVACQTGFMGGFDLSLVVDYWPGIDPAPNPPEEPEVLDPNDPIVQQITNGMDQIWLTLLYGTQTRGGTVPSGWVPEQLDAITKTLAAIPAGGGLTAEQAQQLADIQTRVAAVEAALKGA